MKAIDVITHLMKVLKLTPNKDLQNGSTQHISAYGSFPVGNGLCLIRVADHNTFLYNWIDKNQNIDLTTSANYAITFVDEIPFHSNPNKENNVNAINPPDVIVRQYVYNITALSDDEVTHVMDECIKLAQTGVFTDPLEEDNVKHAIIYRHRTNQPTVDMTSKTRKSHRKKKSAQNKITASQTTQTTENNKTDKNESKNMNRKNTIRLTESELKQIITESVRNIISELDWKTYANAASAAKDRESIFKDDPGYPYRPMVRHYKDDGSLDMEKYQRDSDWQVNQSKQPEKFRQAAYRELSREICGEDDFALFLAKYIPLHGVDDKLQKMLQQYQEGEKYIKNNKTQWSKRR